MAANMPQMGGGAPVRQRPPHQQLSQLIYTQMMQHAAQTNGGWQDQVQTNLRVSNTMNLISNSFLAMPSVDSQQLISHGLAFERDAFMTSPDKGTYEQKISGRLQELFKRRQAHEQSLQNSLNMNAQQQAQAQMMMTQNMMSRGMGQPPQQGFQHLPQQMQPSPNPQQPQQPGVGPGGMPMHPNQQATQMAAAQQMRSQIPMGATLANLTAQERTKIAHLAQAKYIQTPELQRNQIRMMVQQKFTPQQMQQLQAEGMDAVLYFYQTQILQGLKGQHAGANAGNNQAAMQQQQRQMNQAGQHLAGVPNGEFGPFSNVDILNQQKAGLLAQEAGQMVVPASSGPGRNATPQPMGGIQGPNLGPGPNQPGMPNQLQQQFNLPQAQQLKMDQRAAQSQAQIRAQAQAKQMQGQPGGLNGGGPISQSPGMNTLNTPVRQTPVGMGEGQPQMGRPNGPFGQGLDPRFNQGNRGPTMGGNQGMNQNQIISSILAQMPPEQRGVFMALSPEKKQEMFMRWSANQAAKAAQMPGRPQPQPNQFPQGNPMAQFGPGNNMGQQHNPGMPMNAQNQMLLQQRMNGMNGMNAMNGMRNNMPNQGQNRPQLPADTNAFMDSLDVPIKIMEQLRQSQPVPPEIKKWAQLKQWLVQKNAGQNILGQLQNVQHAQLQNLLKQKGVGMPMAQPNMPQQGPQQGPQPPNAQMPQQPTPNMGQLPPNVQVTMQEMQQAKASGRFKDYSDERIRNTLLQMKMRKAMGQNPGAQMQIPQTSQPAVPNVPMPVPPQHNPNTIQQRPQNAGPEVSGPGPTAPARNNRQPQNNRPQQTAPPAAPQKNGLKRASTDDVVEVPNPSSTPVQRPPSQQAQAQAQASAPAQHNILHLNATQLANLSPEQRAKYEAMVKSRQAAGGAGPQLSEEMQRLKAIGQEEHILAAKETYQEIPMTPAEYQETAQRIQAMVGEITKISKILGRWYALTKDDNRARMFFKMRLRIVKQFQDGEKTQILKKAFSVKTTELEGLRAMLEGMVRDVANQYPNNVRRNANQSQNLSESGPQQAATENIATPSTSHSAQQQSQAPKMHQRSSSKSGQTPAAPTTAQPPFSFGAQSPNGQPTYGGKPAITQTDLQLPARKRPRTGQAGLGSGGPSANSSPQVQKASSPEMPKRPGSTEVKAGPKLQFSCPELDCEMHDIGFATEEAQRHHIEEEHIKPRQDPFKYVTESLATSLGLDANGHRKPSPNASTAVQGTSHPSAPSMVPNPSKQGQTPMSRTDATPMSREPSMKRQGSAAGAGLTGLPDTLAGKINTPKPDIGALKMEGGPSQMLGADNSWSMTVDPQDLFRGLGSIGLESGGGGAISDMNVYRAITPNDTPESSKDSASSEPNSDISEGVSLNLQVDMMGFGVWQPFGGGPCADVDSAEVDLNESDLAGTGDSNFPVLSWDDVNMDFAQDFSLDTSLYSLDTS
ncbi:hypothetical protein F5Y04DRAFT_144838 [Hypomontagnella monticulosa]|nr:hypothetical protein F5Y04DRAFT_144838 [Hypomontagnella monticulosa]